MSAILLSTSGGFPKFLISFSFYPYDLPAMWKQGCLFKHDIVSEKVEESFKFTHIAFSSCKYCVAPTVLKIIEWRMNGENPEKKNKNKKGKQNKNNIRASFTFSNIPRPQMDWGSVAESKLQD